MAMPTMTSPGAPELCIRRATRADVPQLADLFEQYRAFYRARPDRAAAVRFLEERLDGEDSTVFIAIMGASGPEMVGFVQLYPSFSSLALWGTEILNDLFIVPGRRREGIARMLLATAIEYARQRGAASVELSTQHTNRSARALYRELGFEDDLEFARLRLALRGNP